MKKKRKWRELPWTVPRVQFRFVKEREDELDILNRRSSETQHRSNPARASWRENLSKRPCRLVSFWADENLIGLLEAQ